MAHKTYSEYRVSTFLKNQDKHVTLQLNKKNLNLQLENSTKYSYKINRHNE